MKMTAVMTIMTVAIVTEIMKVMTIITVVIVKNDIGYSDEKNDSDDKR